MGRSGRTRQAATVVAVALLVVAVLVAFRLGSTASGPTPPTVGASVSSTAPSSSPSAGPSAAGTPSSSRAAPSASAGAPSPIASASPSPAPFQAPSIAWPLPDLDPGLRTRGPRPTLQQLAGFLYGNKSLVSVAPGVPQDDWRLSQPAMSAVAGYADAVSVLPGSSIGLHLAGSDRSARVDVFRLGLDDARLVASVPRVPVAPMVVPRPDLHTGLVEMGWPLAYRLQIPTGWRSGVYLAKLTAAHGQSYVLFIVRPPAPTGLIVVIPMATFEAYNGWNGVSLYRWEPASPTHATRGYKVSFDRPFGTANGAALLFRTAFPLIVWLEDHGYTPGYVADTDLDAHPDYGTSARTIVVVGHAEYWTAGMRGTVLAAEARGVGVVAFGGNLVYRQIRLEPDQAGRSDRTVVCYKEEQLDPVAKAHPELATIEFAKLAVPKPAHDVLGADWGGITLETAPLIVAPGMATFAPDLGFESGDRIPALLGGEVDVLADRAHGLALTETPIVNTAGKAISPTASLWVSPDGAHVFDAGTFAWTWGLDPRYAAALPGFPADRFAHLTAEILAWAGTPPAAP